MRTQLGQLQKRLALAATVALTLGLVAATPGFGPSPVMAETSPSCADPVTSAPTGPATVSAASTAYGQVLVIGSGDYAGCSLYLLTSDELHGLTGAPFACSGGPNPIGLPCDTGLWPALLTKGAPIAGPGVDRHLLGTVSRTDVLAGRVRQVTYAGLPLYRFFLDETPGETEGANLFDPVTSPTGIWYLVNPRTGQPAPGRAQFSLETAKLNDSGSDRTVLSVTMNPDFSVFPNASFPVYTLSTGREWGREWGRDWGRGVRPCSGVCAAEYWPPVLTSGWPIAGPGVDQRALGTIVRPDGSRQVTYDGRPLYLDSSDAYIPGITGTQGIDGAGARTPWGVFQTIPRIP
ncbi:MAG: hypothetical protein ACRDGQ_07540 [Candidatus Limnocylindrales bacterium]